MLHVCEYSGDIWNGRGGGVSDMPDRPKGHNIASLQAFVYMQRLPASNGHSKMSHMQVHNQ